MGQSSSRDPGHLVLCLPCAYGQSALAQQILHKACEPAAIRAAGRGWGGGARIGAQQEGCMPCHATPCQCGGRGDAPHTSVGGTQRHTRHQEIRPWHAIKRLHGATLATRPCNKAYDCIVRLGAQVCSRRGDSLRAHTQGKLKARRAASHQLRSFFMRAVVMLLTTFATFSK